MIETIANTQIKNNKEQIEYMNAFGVVSNNYFIVYDVCEKIRTNIDDTRFVSIQKVRKIRKNALLVGLSVYMIIGVYYFELPLTNKIFFSFLAFSLLILGIVIKEYYYKFKIVKFDNECIEFEVKKKFKEDAKKIQRLLKEKLKKNSRPF